VDDLKPHDGEVMVVDFDGKESALVGEAEVSRTQR
jgi:hypothetical protein